MDKWQADVIFTLCCLAFANSIAHATGNRQWGWVALFASIIIDHWIDHFVDILGK